MKSVKNLATDGDFNSRSAASSVASFDYQPARYGTESHSMLPAVTEVDYVGGGTPETRSRNHTPKGERIPPEGASSDSPKQFVQRIEINGPTGDKPRMEKSLAQSSRTKSKSSAAIDEVKDLLDQPETVNGEPDEFSNLRRLISEGRISGLSEKPPNFIPPTPPNAKRIAVGAKKESGLEKKPSRAAADRPRKSREAPKPPTSQDSPSPTKSSFASQAEPVKSGYGQPEQAKAAGLTHPEPVNPDVKLLTSRHRESLEDLTQMESRRHRSGNVEIKRSSSNHGVRPSGMLDANLIVILYVRRPRVVLSINFKSV